MELSKFGFNLICGLSTFLPLGLIQATTPFADDVLFHEDITAEGSVNQSAVKVGGVVDALAASQRVILAVDSLDATHYLYLNLPSDGTADTGGGSVVLEMIWMGDSSEESAYKKYTLTYTSGAAAPSFSDTICNVKQSNGGLDPDVTFFSNPSSWAGNLGMQLTGLTGQSVVVKVEVLGRTVNPASLVDITGEQPAWDEISNLSLTSHAVSYELNANGDSFFNGGNFGIGTSTPTEKLTVVGNISVTGSITGTFSGQFDSSIAASQITTQKTTDWDLATTYGDHSVENYLKTDSDVTTSGAWCFENSIQIEGVTLVSNYAIELSGTSEFLYSNSSDFRFGDNSFSVLTVVKTNVLNSVCSLSGNNLLNQSHGEYINTFFQQGLSEVERTVMLKLDYHY